MTNKQKLQAFIKTANHLMQNIHMVCVNLPKQKIKSLKVLAKLFMKQAKPKYQLLFIKRPFRITKYFR